MATTSKLNQDIIQTKARAAAKTFLQVFVGAAGLLFLAWIASAMNIISGGGDVRDIDLTPLVGIVATGVLAGISALTSLAMNWGKAPVPPPAHAPGDEG